MNLTVCWLQVSSMNTALEAENSTKPAAAKGHITCTEDYRFMLYRHWSLYESMFHSNYVASKLRVWMDDGALPTWFLGTSKRRRDAHTPYACRQVKAGHLVGPDGRQEKRVPAKVRLVCPVEVDTRAQLTRARCVGAGFRSCPLPSRSASRPR